MEICFAILFFLYKGCAIQVHGMFRPHQRAVSESMDDYALGVTPNISHPYGTQGQTFAQQCSAHSAYQRLPEYQPQQGYTPQHIDRNVYPVNATGFGSNRSHPYRKPSTDPCRTERQTFAQPCSPQSSPYPPNYPHQQGHISQHINRNVYRANETPMRLQSDYERQSDVGHDQQPDSPEKHPSSNDDLNWDIVSELMEEYNLGVIPNISHPYGTQGQKFAQQFSTHAKQQTPIHPHQQGYMQARNVHDSGASLGPSKEYVIPVPGTLDVKPEDDIEGIRKFMQRYVVLSDTAEVLWYLAWLRKGGETDAATLVNRVAEIYGTGVSKVHRGVPYWNGEFRKCETLARRMRQALPRIIGGKTYHELYEAAESAEVLKAIRLARNVHTKSTSLGPSKKYVIPVPGTLDVKPEDDIEGSGVTDATTLVNRVAKIYGTGVSKVHRGVPYPNGEFLFAGALDKVVGKIKKNDLEGCQTGLCKAAESKEVREAIVLARCVARSGKIQFQ